MPRAGAFPPTPAPSTDIKGQIDVNVGSLDPSFALPPAAIASRGSASSSSVASHSSDSSYRPVSPTSPAVVAGAKDSQSPQQPRKRSSTTSNAPIITKDDYTLPPPPTRSRKIIQMKPRAHEPPTPELNKAQQTPVAVNGKPPTPVVAAPAAPVAPTSGGGKRKQANGTTAAGRKIARKTAHSLIERRRRSKMNEEFGVLKDMIPACTGQEMHKLAILQASIDYMRYLEQCVQDLKASHNSRQSPNDFRPTQSPTPLPPPRTGRLDDVDEEDDEEDEEMEDAVSPTTLEPNHMLQHSKTHSFSISPSIIPSIGPSPAIAPSDDGRFSAQVSPALRAQDVQSRHRYPYASVQSANTSPALQPSDPHHYSITASPAMQAVDARRLSFASYTPRGSTLPSPAMGAHLSHQQSAPAHFSLTSPALQPQSDDQAKEDHEATAALLMLNSDRRSWSQARGMSVKELLSG